MNCLIYGRNSLDHFIIAEILRRIIPDSEATSIYSPGQFEGLLESKKFSYDIVLYDFDLPTAEDRFFLQQYDLLHSSLSTSFYILSSWLAQEDKEALACMRCVRGFISKPFDRSTAEKLLKWMTSERTTG
jgi:hypothetical protein